MRPLCWCGAVATHNARTVDGRMVTEGDQVVVGDTAAVDELPPDPSAFVHPRDEHDPAYEVVCRRHHRQGMTRSAAQAARPSRCRSNGGAVNGPLIEPTELAAALDAGTADLVLADVRWTVNGPPGRPEFEAGHVPGAQYVDLETELSRSPGTGGRHPLPSAEVLQASLRRIGVGTNSLVVAYDGATSQAASRLWWLLTDAGHTRTRVLNGGFAAWQRAGLPVETGPARTVPRGDAVIRPGERGRVGADEIAACVAAGRPVVDVRAADRFAGTTSHRPRGRSHPRRDQPAVHRQPGGQRAVSRRRGDRCAVCRPGRAGAVLRIRGSPPPTPCWLSSRPGAAG